MVRLLRLLLWPQKMWRWLCQRLNFVVSWRCGHWGWPGRGRAVKAVRGRHRRGRHQRCLASNITIIFLDITIIFLATTLNYCSTIAIIVTTVNSHTILDTLGTFWATFITLGRFGLFQRLPSPYGLYDLHDGTVKYQLKFRCSLDNYYTLAFSVALRSRENPAGRRGRRHRPRQSLATSGWRATAAALLLYNSATVE